MKDWVQIVVNILTPIVVLYMGVQLNDKRSHDLELLREVKDIKSTLNESAVIFARMSTKVDYIEHRLERLEKEVETLNNK